MAIQGFDYQEQVLGTGDTTAYDFNFLITDPSQIHIYIQDSLGNIVNDTLANDTAVVAGVSFDPLNGGGTVTLVQQLGNQFILTMLLANDAPDQPTDFPNKTSFDLSEIESALDYMAAWGQRIAFLAQRALRLHDLDDIYSFDMRLPLNLSANPDGFIKVNSTGNGWAVQSLTDMINQAIASAQAIIQYGQGTPLYKGPFAAISPGTNANLAGEVTSSTQYQEVDYVVRIKRGTIICRQEFTIFYRNSLWELVLGEDRYSVAGGDHNVTFTVDPTTAQINAAVANDGGANATIDLFKTQWPG